MTDDSTTPLHIDELRYRIARGLHSLTEDIDLLEQELQSIEYGGSLTDAERKDISESLQTYITIIDAQFHHVTRLVEGTPETLFDIDFDNQPDDSLQATVTNAHDQFTEVIAPVPDALAANEFGDTDWSRFYGSGYGHSYGFAIAHVAQHCVSVVQDEPAGAEQSPSGSADDGGTTTATTSQPSPSSETTQSTHTERVDDDGSDTDVEQDSPWPGYTGEFIQTPEGDDEPLATDVQLPKRASFTLIDVEYSMVLEPPCKYACPNEGRYILTLDVGGDRRYVRVCTNHLPADAEALARGHRFWKEGSMQTEGETFTTLKASNNTSTEWIEKHAVSDGRSGGGDLLARLTYRLMNDTLYISVQDCVTEHGREGGYSVDIDAWNGAIPYIDGDPIGRWLIKRAKSHRNRLLENDGVSRHLVSIDRDKRVINRAQKAYRERNPDFSQPGGLINDHTPVVESCIPVCADCGKLVAGVTPDDAEPCEACGCDEAEWKGGLNEGSDTEAAT